MPSGNPRTAPALKKPLETVMPKALNHPCEYNLLRNRCQAGERHAHAQCQDVHEVTHVLAPLQTDVFAGAPAVGGMRPTRLDTSDSQ
jgi:hypothetical protein